MSMQREIDELNKSLKRASSEILKLQKEKQDILRLNFVYRLINFRN